MSDKAPVYLSKYLIAAYVIVMLGFTINAAEAGLRADSLGMIKSSAFALGFAILLWIHRKGVYKTTYVVNPVLRLFFPMLMLIGTVIFVYELFARYIG